MISVVFQDVAVVEESTQMREIRLQDSGGIVSLAPIDLMSWQVVDHSSEDSNWRILVRVPFQAEGACWQMIPEGTGTVPPGMGYHAFVPCCRQILEVNEYKPDRGRLWLDRSGELSQPRFKKVTSTSVAHNISSSIIAHRRDSAEVDHHVTGSQVDIHWETHIHTCIGSRRVYLSRLKEVQWTLPDARSSRACQYTYPK